MASSILSPLVATTHLSRSTPFLLKSKDIPTSKNPKRRYKVSCQSNHDQESKFDRRDILIGLGGLYGAGSLAASPFAFSEPIITPDVKECGPPEPPATGNCCPPYKYNGEITDFVPPCPSKLRVRPAAQAVDADYIAKFNRAVGLMRDLPDDDPRSFKQQANVHCAYCDGAYHQVGFPKDDPDFAIQVHYSWLFFPFHRIYLYFFERILGKLIDDPTFAMPFWNWDAPAGMQIPSFYTIPETALFDQFRDKNHQPPVIVDLDFHGKDCCNPQIKTNLSIMYRQMLQQSKTPRQFFGAAYRGGDHPSTIKCAGSIERVPHNTLHSWTGDRCQPNGEDMGIFYSAARDPIFYAHHSNVDRLWTVWKTLGGKLEKHDDISDPDYLDSSFLFYDENKKLVRVKVRDCLDPARLGYTYQDVEILWKKEKYRPKPKIPSELRRLKAKAGDEAPTPREVFRGKLDRVRKVMVKRPKKSRSKEEKEELEEILVIQGIEVHGAVYTKFNVYINDDDHEATTAANTEFAGSFVNLPHKHENEKKIKTQLRLSITNILEDLGAEDDEQVLVTLVPISNGDAFTIDDIKIVLGDDD